MASSSRIVIVGGGTFGLSTAYHLAKSGYTDITVIDKSEYLPSSESAGNDLNKIIRAEYEDPWYAELALV
jgi:sarcosine oxidase/L-pipecolate oxidase